MPINAVTEISVSHRAAVLLLAATLPLQLMPLLEHLVATIVISAFSVLAPSLLALQYFTNAMFVFLRLRLLGLGLQLSVWPVSFELGLLNQSLKETFALCLASTDGLAIALHIFRVRSVKVVVVVTVVALVWPLCTIGRSEIVGVGDVICARADASTS